MQRKDKKADIRSLWKGLSFYVERTEKGQFWRLREPVEDLLSLVIEARHVFKGEGA